jgi:hypothetical protein
MKPVWFGTRIAPDDLELDARNELCRQLIDEIAESCRSGLVVLLFAFHTYIRSKNQPFDLAGPGLALHADRLALRLKVSWRSRRWERN